LQSARRVSRLGAALVIAILVFAVVAFIRLRLAGAPLERDEGEYAYAGQLILQGVPPYQAAYNMKLPGTYAAYAALMAVFGQSAHGIHLGLALVNGGAVLFLFLLGRRLFSAAAGLAAAASYALLSACPDILGTSAHATHFVVLPALAATLLLLRGLESGRLGSRSATAAPLKTVKKSRIAGGTACATKTDPVLAMVGQAVPPADLLLHDDPLALFFWSGALYGLGFLMKQHGIFLVAFGAATLAGLAFSRANAGASALRRARPLLVFLVGAALPFAVTCGILWRAGVFRQFWFWTFDYARAYVSQVSLREGVENFWSNFAPIAKPNLTIWLLAAAGLVLAWLRKDFRRHAPFLTGFLACSFAAVCPGLYFREHYFILVLPAVCLLAGAGVELLARMVKPVFPYCILAAALAWSLYAQREFFFHMTPVESSREMYGMSPFPEAVAVAGYIRGHSAPDARIAVLGSEPEIYFYARRRSATGYIYGYPLMESQPFALAMQNQTIAEIEAARPRYVVMVNVATSWLRDDDSPGRIFDWWDSYRGRYQRVGVADMISEEQTEYRWDAAAAPEAYAPKSENYLAVYRRNE
jgi:hypothetical protein